MKTPTLPLGPRHGPALAPTASPVRHHAARGLRAASALLAGLAQRLHESDRVAPQAEPLLEFHAEAGAPEGALYVDGRLVGTLEGVTRL